MTAAQFRDACERFGLTQEAAAKFLGVSLRTVNGYANGASIPKATAKLLRLMIRRNIKPENV